jgi:hypothetical protein
MMGGMVRLIDRRSAAVWLGAFLVLAIAGCGSGAGGSTSPPPNPSPTIAPGPGMGTGELRLSIIEQLGRRWYCDPDEYPVGRDEQQAALDRYEEMVTEDELFPAVAKELGIDPAALHTDAQKLELYRLWKLGLSIPLEPIGNDRYRFDFLAQPVGGASEGVRTAGIIDTRGTITVEQHGLEGEPNCPICLDRLTTIDTPTGPVAVDRLRLGDLVWTLDRRGRRVAGTVIALGSTPAPADHQVTRLMLADGRSVTASPGHPLADERALSTLSIGDLVDGSEVVALETIRYSGGETFDLVVSGATGIYFAGGIPLGSTLD